MVNRQFSQLIESLSNRPIVFVGGKGGVGKTTTAAAIASRFASLQQKTLIISTDPAHSLGDALQVALSNDKTAITPYLDALELNPDVIVDKHFAQVLSTIKGYASPEMLPKIKEHLNASKTAPGAQEAAMLEAMCQYLVDAKAQGYHHIVFDTAPTGHTLRLLLLPEMMQAWTDGLLVQQRRQAKLKSVANHLTVNRLANTNLSTTTDKAKGFANPFTQHIPDRWEQAVSVLDKRKQLFASAGKLLHDATQTAIVLVMIADNLPIAETKRAVEQLQAVKLPVSGIVVNQLIDVKQSDPFWQQRAERQQRLLGEIEQSFANIPLYPIALQQQDIRGVEALAGFG
ncbi:arsenite-transporting ATPase [Moraxella macacae 0408225]|uniref:arsenite-transporting ATPase n=1 Tax=Moraxella macacae 0408225 TaxID=1230338 RepID=L2F7W0_9GAMM|nr:ArsA family ATPase [Moraxella macacae]ELA09144.1 arsenite-transporting ATPase [Moraxella macacae 0408225]